MSNNKKNKLSLTDKLKAYSIIVKKFSGKYYNTIIPIVVLAVAVVGGYFIYKEYSSNQNEAKAAMNAGYGCSGYGQGLYGTGDCTLLPSSTLFITSDKINFSPAKSNPRKFTAADLTLTLNNDSRFLASGATAICKFQITKYAEATNLTQTHLVALNGGSYNTATGYFEVPYDATNGCSVKLPAASQDTPKWDFSVVVVRSDGQYFSRDESYFMLYGSIGVVTIT
jgi:hypothetical protein